MTEPGGELEFWLRFGDGAARCTAAIVRLLRYGTADVRSWNGLRGGLMLMAVAIGDRFNPVTVAQVTTVTIPGAVEVIDNGDFMDH